MSNPEIPFSPEVKRELGLTIVKLGGSVITYKDSPTPLVREEILSVLVKDTKDLVQRGHKLIIVHGAGSFGHPLAKRYELNKGMRTEEQRLGYGMTVCSMLELNYLVTRQLLKAGVPAVGLPPHSFAYQIESRLQDFDPALIKKFLDQDFVPILFGDAVLDEMWGCSILSGDVIVPYLAKRLQARRVVFLSDVDGVFNSDPKLDPRAKQISLVTNENLATVLQTFSFPSDKRKRADVTGEMEGKILALKRNLAGIEVVITSGFIAGNLIKGVQGEDVGTKIFFE